MNLKREVVCAPCEFETHGECRIARGMWRCVCPCEKHPRRQQRKPTEHRTWAGRDSTVMIVNDGDGFGHSIVGDFTVRLGPLEERGQGPVEASAVYERSGQR